MIETIIISLFVMAAAAGALTILTLIADLIERFLP